MLTQNRRVATTKITARLVSYPECHLSIEPKLQTGGRVDAQYSCNVTRLSTATLVACVCMCAQVLVHASAGARKCWCTQLLVHASAGARSCWCTQLLVHASAGARKCWCTQVLVHASGGIRKRWCTQMHALETLSICNGPHLALIEYTIKSHL